MSLEPDTVGRPCLGPPASSPARSGPTPRTCWPPSRPGPTSQLDAPGLFTSIAPDAGLIPEFVTGALTGRVEPGDRFAVAINGRLAGVGSAYSAGADIRLGVLVPPELLRAGDNRVEVFSVQGQGRATRLTRVPRTDTVLEAKLARS